MSAPRVAIANFRRDGLPYYSNNLPTIADSYDPVYSTPQTKYGSCSASGSVLRINSCNYQQNGAVPMVVGDGSQCVCVLPSGSFGCFNNESERCM
jgi:hypothetical protein